MNHVPANPNALECASFEVRIHELMDHRQPLSSDKELEFHAESCGKCLNLMAEYIELESALTELKPRAPHFATASRASVAVSDSSFWNQPTGRAFAVIATIAAVLLMSTLLASNLADSRGSSASLIAPASSPTVAPIGNTFGIAEASFIGDRDIAQQPEIVRSVPTPRSSGLLEQHSQPILIAWGVRNLNGVSESLEPLKNYYGYSSELPGVRPLQCSLSITIDLLQKSIPWDWQSPISPDLGAFDSYDLRPIA